MQIKPKTHFTKMGVNFTFENHFKIIPVKKLLLCFKCLVYIKLIIKGHGVLGFILQIVKKTLSAHKFCISISTRLKQTNKHAHNEYMS